MTMDAESLFETLIDNFAGRPGVTLPGEPPGHGFGSNALRINGSIFAMQRRGQLVVTLPQKRVDELIADGVGEPFDAGKGTRMKQWLRLLSLEEATWMARAEEAFEFAATKAHKKAKKERPGR
jgi:hypothetical protein